MDDLATKLARAALCGFFGTDGFSDMSVGQRKQAVKAVREVYVLHELELVEKDLKLACDELDSIAADIKSGKVKL